MREKKKLPTERERLEVDYEYIKKQEAIYHEMGKLKDGRELRKYIKAHRENIKRYGVKVPIIYRYPYLPVIISALALAVSVAASFFR